MTKPAILFTAALTGAASLFLTAPAPAVAQPGGKLTTLPLGQYRCSVPGNAAGQAWVPVPEMDFVISNASTYNAANGNGTYLATAKTVTFTRGAMKGTQFNRRSGNILQKREANGKPGRLRCVREGRAR